MTCNWSIVSEIIERFDPPGTRGCANSKGGAWLTHNRLVCVGVTLPRFPRIIFLSAADIDVKLDCPLRTLWTSFMLLAMETKLFATFF